MNKIVITGGNFINKGAQSMLFSLVDGIKKKYDPVDVIMIDIFPSLNNEDKRKYNFTILNMHIRSILRLTFPILKLALKPKSISDNESFIIEQFKSADIVLDISGYGVSSHNQNALWTYATIFPFKLARKFNIPVILMPQSIGPFEFKSWKKIIIWPLIKKNLQYPKIIFTREPECKKYLSKIRTKGVIDAFDLVLQSDEYDVHNIYKEYNTISQIKYKIKNDSVVVIPNKQLTKLVSLEKVIELFTEAINHLLSKNIEVIIMRHSKDDNNLCNLIYNKCSTPLKITLINDDLTPYEIEEILNSSKLVITSRYHGLIHALKIGKPCFVIGWANKYEHVMDSFNLSNYYFDIRKISTQTMIDKLNTLVSISKDEEKKILDKLSEIRHFNLYDYI